MPAKPALTPSRPTGSSGGRPSRTGDAPRRSSRDESGPARGRDGLPVPRSQQRPDSSRAARFWECQDDAFLFKGPLGEPVGVLPKGTVVWEQQRYEDPFRGWWVATGTKEGELGWIDCSHSSSGGLLEGLARSAADPLWLPVIETPSTSTAAAAADTRRSRAGTARAAAAAAADKPQPGSAAATNAAADDADLNAPPALPGAAVEYHAPCRQDGSTGLSLDNLESLLRQQVPSTLELFEYYWSSVASAAPNAHGEDWNQTYQTLVEAVIHQGDTLTDADAARDLESGLEAAETALYQFLESFYDTAEEIAVLFVKDQLAPTSARQLKPHPQRRDVMYYKGLLVTVCIDTPAGAYGGQANAKKAASNAFRSYALAAAEGPKNLLYVPLQTLVSFHGYALFVSTIPPVDASGCLYPPLRRLRFGPSAAQTSAGSESGDATGSGSAVAPPLEDDMPEVLRYLCMQFTQSLNLAEHSVTAVDAQTDETHTWKTTLPITTELYAGRDRRLYLVAGADRLLPASLPLPPPSEETASDPRTAAPLAANGGRRRSSTGSSSVSAKSTEVAGPAKLLRASLLERVRPELLVQWAAPLNCDVALDGCHDANDVVVSADVADFIKRDAITAVASMLGLQLPVDTTPLPPLPCTLCQSVMENELRFVVCQHASRCCRICAHCYTKRLYDHFNQSTPGEGGAEASPTADAAAVAGEWRTQVHFADAVQCGALPRPPDALQLEPSVTRLAHASGLNLRYLPFVYYRLPMMARFAMERYCEVELVARAAAHVLDDKLHRVASVEDVYATIQQFFLCLLQSKAAEAQRFWAKELGPCIESTFHGICTPLDVSQLPVLLLAERVEALTGVELSAESRASLSLDKPFVEIARVSPRVKRVRPPHYHVSQVQAEAARMRGMLSKLLLFWIGYAPKQCVDEWQPLYLLRAASSSA